MNQPVAGHDAVVEDIVVRAVKGRYGPAGLADQQDAGRHIPRFQFQLPEAVQSSGSNIGQIQCGCTGPADAAGSLLKGDEVVKIVGRIAGAIVGETGSQQGVLQGRA